MRTGVIIGSAIAGAATAALLTLNRREKGIISDFFSNIKNKTFRSVENLKDKFPRKLEDLVSDSITKGGRIGETLGKKTGSRSQYMGGNMPKTRKNTPFNKPRTR